MYLLISQRFGFFPKVAVSCHLALKGFVIREIIKSPKSGFLARPKVYSSVNKSLMSSSTTGIICGPFLNSI